MLTGGVDVEPVPLRPGAGAADLRLRRSCRRVRGVLCSTRRSPPTGRCSPSAAASRCSTWPSGGRSHQHITDRAGLGSHGTPNGGGGASTSRSKPIRARGWPKLLADARDGRCHHHQAVERVGDGLVVTGRAAGRHHRRPGARGQPWVVGVQWHPGGLRRPRPAAAGPDRPLRERSGQGLSDSIATSVAAASVPHLERAKGTG